MKKLKCGLKIACALAVFALLVAAAYVVETE